MEDDLLDWYYQPTVDDSSYYDSLTGYEDVPTYTSSTDAYADPWASGAWDYSSYDPYTYDYSSTVEITNAAQPGEPGYGWRYFSDGTSIGPDGTYYTTNDQGQTASVWSPTSGIGSFLSNLGPSISSGLQKAFTKSDGTTDWSRVAGAATGIYSLLKNSGSGGSGGAEQPKGYQGGIPKYEAVRAQIPYDYSYDADSGRRPGLLAVVTLRLPSMSTPPTPLLHRREPTKRLLHTGTPNNPPLSLSRGWRLAALPS